MSTSPWKWKIDIFCKCGARIRIARIKKISKMNYPEASFGVSENRSPLSLSQVGEGRFQE